MSAATGRVNVKKFNITIPINPVPWERPKTRVVNGWVKHYNSTKTANYEKAIGEYWRQATNGFMYDREQTLNVNLVFGLPIPKSTSKKKTELMANGTIRHTKRPDVDNLAKSVIDGLNGVAWVEDSQVVRVSIYKEYAKEPYVYIYIHDDAE